MSATMDHPLIRTIRDPWIPVRCSGCGWYLCSIKTGSVVKITCRKCKTELVTDAA